MFWLSSNKGLQGFMMMLVIKIATDVTVSSSAFAEIYIASPSGNKDIDQKQYEIKALFAKEACWYLFIQLTWNKLLLNWKKCLVFISVFVLIANKILKTIMTYIAYFGVSLCFLCSGLSHEPKCHGYPAPESLPPRACCWDKDLLPPGSP